MKQQIIIDGDDESVILYPDFYTLGSDAVYNGLLAQSDWQQEYIKMYGKTHPVPRLTAWYGDEDYTYSGVYHPTKEFFPLLEQIREHTETYTETQFNSVLLNLYRNGQDSVSWHSDDEPELGQNPCIASLSFGATRRFQLKHKTDKTQKVSIDLPHGSLLLMQGSIQKNWQHAVPKTAKPVKPRINLTFRQTY